MAKEVVGKLPKNRTDDVWFCKQLLNASVADDVSIYTSSLTIAECQHAEGICDDDVQRLFNGILTSGQYVVLVQDSILIAEEARNLLWTHRLKFGGADSVHMASAISMGCTEFITSDTAGFLKEPRRTEIFEKLRINVIRARDTVLLPSSYRQTNLDYGKTSKKN